MKKKISEVIIVEGRDDIINLKQYIDAEIIATHGYGISKQTLIKIETAYKNKGIIIFTDPDFAGERIRRRLNEAFPDAKNAFVAKEDALKKENIGIENAKGEIILNALKMVRSKSKNEKEEFIRNDLIKNNLIGKSESAVRRNFLGKILGIGYANGKQLLNRLNGYGISRDEFENALKDVNDNFK